MLLQERTIFFSAIFFTLCLAQAQAQVRLNPAEAEKLLLETSEPVYPAIARAAKVKGVLRVEVIISEQGAVSSAKVISGHPLLQNAALDAVKKRKYKAYMVGNKPVPIITIVYITFPFSTPTSTQGREHERQEQLATQYSEESSRCRNLVREQKWKEAEYPCWSATRIANQLSDDRALEKMGAYRRFGYVMIGQRRFEEALEYAKRALDAVQSKLTEKDGEIGQLYGDIAIAYHLLHDLGKAREFYRKAENSYHLAISDIGDEMLEERYRDSLKKILGYHLIAAEQSGATAEVEEVKRMLENIL